MLAAAVLALGVALAGCGKTLPAEGQGRGAAVTTVASTGQLAASGLATKNTTRLGGADPVADAAAVALATYPGLTPASRPQAVVLVDARDWPAALAATALASAPLRAPLLYSEGDSLPAISAQALAALKPTGAALLGGAQVIEVGTTAAPAGYRIRTLGGAQTSDGPVGSGHSGGGPTGGPTSDGQAGGGSGAEAARAPAAVAAQVERLVEILHGGAPHRVLAIGAAGPRALAMPAAGLAAESGAPVLPVGAAGIPPATRAVLLRLRRPTIYAVGPPAAVSHTVLSKLARLGSVRRIYAGPVAGGGDPAENAIAVARFGEGAFGWTIEQPGHGLVFANASRPLDAPAAAPLSASGEYGPLLLLERPDQVPVPLAEFLGDIKPGYNSEYPPAKGAYNHGWLIGDGQAITATVQAELDAMLEISPVPSAGSSSSSASATPPATSSSSTATTTPPTTSTPSP